MRHASPVAGEPDELEHLGDAGPAAGPGQPERHVGLHAQVGEEGRLLRHDRGTAAVRRHVDAGAGDEASGEVDAAGVEALEPGQDAQERRLAAPGRAQHGQEFALADVERDAGQGPDGAEGLLDGAHLHAAGHGSLLTVPLPATSSQVGTDASATSSAA